ncbi:MAG: hypothetical protein NZ937_01680 [Armatimonadetes bacterium]|nr:hypothetical protein [Armatimonadota bacterium]
MGASMSRLAAILVLVFVFGVALFWSIRLQRKPVEFLTEHTEAVDMQPSISPDSKTLAFIRFKELMLLDLSSRQIRKVKPEGLGMIAYPSWSPDGKKLAFSAIHSKPFHKSNLGMHLIVMDLKSHKWECLTPDFDYNIRPSWSPDGKKLVFAKSSKGTVFLCIYDFQSKQLKRINSQWGRSPAWSPDGKTIAFISGRKGNPDVWLMDADGRNLRPIFEDEGTDEDMPCWTPDGKFLIFTRQTSLAKGPEQRDLWVVRVSDKKAFQLTECQKDWWAISPCVSNDSKSVIFALRRSDHSVICRIFVDWNEIKVQKLSW